MRVIVTAFRLDGCAGFAGDPGSFSTMRSVALPTSLKTVGHGLVVLHGGGVVTLVITSDVRLLTSVVFRLPCAAWSVSITSMTGALLWRTTSPHETDAAMIAASPRILVVLRIQLLALDDSRRDEDQELGALIVDGVALEQPTEQRDLAQSGRPI